MRVDGSVLSRELLQEFEGVFAILWQMQMVEMTSVWDEKSIRLERSDEASPRSAGRRLVRTRSVTFLAPAIDGNLVAFHHVCHVHFRVHLLAIVPDHSFGLLGVHAVVGAVVSHPDIALVGGISWISPQMKDGMPAFDGHHRFEI